MFRKYGNWLSPMRFRKKKWTQGPRQTKHQPPEVQIVGLGPTWVPAEPGCSTFLLSRNTVFLSGVWNCTWLQTLSLICWQKRRVFAGASRVCYWARRRGQRFNRRGNSMFCTSSAPEVSPTRAPAPASLLTPSWPCYIRKHLINYKMWCTLVRSSIQMSNSINA